MPESYLDRFLRDLLELYIKARESCLQEISYAFQETF